jgi:predicted Zn-dependent peptidase
LKNIKTRDVKEFYKSHFNLANMVVSVCTDLTAAKMIEILTPFAERMTPGIPVTVPDMPPPRLQKRDIFVSKDKRQTVVSLAYGLPKIDRKGFALAFLLENLLGKGIGSKMWYLRSHHELAYSVAAEFTQYIHSGVLSLYLRTQNDKKERAYDEFVKMIAQLEQTGIDRTLFTANRTHAIADFFRQNESKDRKSMMAVYFDMLGLGPDYFIQFPNILTSVTLEEFNKFLKNVLSANNRVAVIVGPQDIQKN